MADQRGNPPIEWTREGTETAPEDPVVHQQKVDALLHRQADRRLGGIHGRANPGHSPVVRDLKTIEGLRRVTHGPYVEVAIQVADHIKEAHGMHSKATLVEHDGDTDIHTGGVIVSVLIA